MTTYVISYDLKEAGQDYSALSDAIKALADTWWQCLESTWLIKTEMNSFEVATSLRAAIDANDSLLVVNAGSDAAWTGFSDECEEWLRTQL